MTAAFIGRALEVITSTHRSPGSICKVKVGMKSNQKMANNNQIDSTSMKKKKHLPLFVVNKIIPSYYSRYWTFEG